MANEVAKSVATQEEITEVVQNSTKVINKMSKALKVKPVSEFKPDYGNDKEKMSFLADKTKDIEREISNIVQNNDLYGAVGVSGNVVINLREAVKNGIHVYGMEVNREHGNDEKQTGKSLLTDGAQMWLNVITYKIAKLYGIGIKRLANDKDDN